MEIALPHVVVSICGPGIGPDLVPALSTHPLEVSEARDLSESRRVAGGRPATLVILTDPPDVSAAVAETSSLFPGTPILLVTEAIATEAARSAAIDTIRADQPLDDLCWFVLEAVSRAARCPTIAERPLGPVMIEVDGQGIVRSTDADLEDLLLDGHRIRTGESILDVIDSRDRGRLAAALKQSARGETRFYAIRILNDRGGRHTVAAGVRGMGGGRVAVLMQAVVASGPIVGRHIGIRDPITGLLTRWAISREIEEPEMGHPPDDTASVVLLRLDDCEAIADRIGHRQTDVVLMRVAAALGRAFPHPALTSRLLGASFLAFLPATGVADAERRAQDLLLQVNQIEIPRFAPGFMLRASIGVAAVGGGDADLAIRQAEAAAAEALAAGGNRAVVAGSAAFTPAQSGELTADMDLGSWEVWLQPVTAAGAARPAFHEALARFASGRRRVVSRADYFLAGRAAGLLERFDRMMLLRVLEMLASRPDVRLSANVSHETFAGPTFPATFIDLVRDVPGAADRLILEIAPRCLTAPPDDVHKRLTALADAGIAVAIDDFGSGICRLRSLTQFPIAIVKLDELVTGYVDDDPLQREFVRTVVSLCHARGLTIVAEYTRSHEQLARLVDDGVDLFQGELFGMPRPAADALPAPAETARG